MRKLSVCAIGLALLVPAFADNLITGKGESWKVYNGEPAKASFWDINKAQTTGTVVSFPIQQFLTPSTGSFAIYLLNNYNVDMTGKTIAADMYWTSGTYETRSTTFSGAYVRVEFQDVTAGPFTSNDYWWYTANLDLNNTVASGTLTAPLTDRANWTNLCGQSATDTTPHPGNVCGWWTDPAVSPSDGFDKAMKSVKQVGLSFGSGGSYASGVALDGGIGTFNLTRFTITTP